MILAIDFDDTIHDPTNRRPGYRMGQPTKGAIMSIQRLHQHHNIVIFTARNVQEPAARKAVADWLDYFKIPYDAITNIKSTKFDLMIDNRGVHFDNWPKVMHFLDTLTPEKLNQYTHEDDLHERPQFDITDSVE